MSASKPQPEPSVDSSDVLMFLGVLLVTIATALISVPAAVAFVGLVCIALGIVQAWKG